MILKNFIEYFIIYFENLNIKLNYSSQMNELILKYLDNSFKGYLDNMLYSNIKNILQNINHEYKIKINKDLENIGILIEEKEKDILKEITFIQIQQTNLIFSKINEYYNDLDLSYNKYNNNNILKIDNKINEYIESLFIHITDELKNITKTFNDEEKKGKINLEEILTINDNYLIYH